jgi:hypothetical protein
LIRMSPEIVELLLTALLRARVPAEIVVVPV